MGYDFYDRSNHDSRPTALYQFSVGIRLDNGEFDYDAVTFYYTSMPSDYEYQGIVYKAAAVNDDGITLTTQTQTNQFKIILPKTTEIAKIFLTSPPNLMVRAVVRHKQIEDDEAPIYWVGFVSYVDHDVVKATVNCADLTSFIANGGSHTDWTRGCNHSLFDHRCRVDKTAFAVEAIIASRDGKVLTCEEAASYDAGYFSSGFLEYPRWSETAVDRRIILKSEGSKITVGGSVELLTVGTKIKLYPGCDLSKGSGGCAKFKNLSNYGGYTFMVGRSPYDGNAITTGA